MPADASDAESGKPVIEGNLWTYPWDIKQDGKTVYFRVVNVFTAPGTIEYRKELSTDKTHWTVMAKDHEKQ